MSIQPEMFSTPPTSGPSLAARTPNSTSPAQPTKPPAFASASRPTPTPVSQPISSTRHVHNPLAAPLAATVRPSKPRRFNAHHYRLRSQLRKRAAADAAPDGAD